MGKGSYGTIYYTKDKDNRDLATKIIKNHKNRNNALNIEREV